MTMGRVLPAYALALLVGIVLGTLVGRVAVVPPRAAPARLVPVPDAEDRDLSRAADRVRPWLGLEGRVRLLGGGVPGPARHGGRDVASRAAAAVVGRRARDVAPRGAPQSRHPGRPARDPDRRPDRPGRRDRRRVPGRDDRRGGRARAHDGGRLPHARDPRHVRRDPHRLDLRLRPRPHVSGVASVAAGVELRGGADRTSAAFRPAPALRVLQPGGRPSRAPG